MMKTAVMLDKELVSPQGAQPPVASAPHNPDHWQAFMVLLQDRFGQDGLQLSWREHVIPARANICLPATWWEDVPIIFSGWAISSFRLPQGRQQILSFLLPGDIVSTALIFRPMAGYQIQAVTKVHYRAFNRVALKTALFKHPELFEKFSNVWIEERAAADQLAADLGHRTADERLARLILKLWNRSAQRGLVQGQNMEFPLRQHQIADATGLTAVHVSRVLGEFRRSGLVEIEGRSLKLLDARGLYRVANLETPPAMLHFAADRSQ